MKQRLDCRVLDWHVAAVLERQDATRRAASSGQRRRPTLNGMRPAPRLLDPVPWNAWALLDPTRQPPRVISPARQPKPPQPQSQEHL
jgi:hypothetical protein